MDPDELEVLEAIFESNPETFIKITEKSYILTINFDQINIENSFLKFIPSIKLLITAVEGYPDECNLDIKIAEAPFLKNFEKKELLKEINDIYEEGCPVIYDIYDHLLNLDLNEKYFNRVDENGEPENRIQKFQTINFFIDYNEQRLQENFNKQEFTCGICFTDFLGIFCCYNPTCKQHIYCKNCVKSYLRSKIENRDLSIEKPIPKCMEPKCDKGVVDTVATIQDLVGNEYFEKYNLILTENLLLEEQENIYYCPRESCKSPISISDKSDINSISCGNCPYIFCGICGNSGHRNQPCQLRKLNFQEIFTAYENQDNETIKILEKKYHRNIKKLLDDAKSEALIKNVSKPCPHCKVKTTKMDGCNRMDCRYCKTPWCWLCGVSLKGYANPYHHFDPDKNPTSRCANQLFMGIETEGERHGDLDFNRDDAWRLFV